MIAEADFQRALEIAANAPERPMRIQRINSGQAKIPNKDGSYRRFRGARKGTADFIGIAHPDGLYLEIEAKRFDADLRPQQQIRHELINAMGGVHIRVRALEHGLEESVRLAIEEIDAAIAKRRARR